MYIFVAALLLLCAISGLLDSIFAFFKRVPSEKQEPNHLQRKAVRIKRGQWSFWVCISNFVFLTTGIASPLLILASASMLLVAGYFLSRFDLYALLGK